MDSAIGRKIRGRLPARMHKLALRSRLTRPVVIVVRFVPAAAAREKSAGSGRPYTCPDAGRLTSPIFSEAAPVDESRGETGLALAINRTNSVTFSSWSHTRLIN